MSEIDAYARRDDAAPAGTYRERSPSPRRGRDESNGAGRSPVGGGRGRSASPGRGRMDVDRGRQPQQYAGSGGDNPGNNLHVSSLSARVDQRDLEEMFGKYGPVDKAQIMFDPHTKESRGFAFVTMNTTEDADAAIAALNGTDLQGKTMRVEKARRGRARTPTPGRYHGPPKPDERRGPAPYRGGGGGGYDRPYDPKPYDSRYAAARPSPAYGSPAPRSYYDDPYYASSSRYAEEPRGGRYDDRRGDYRDDRYAAPPPPRRDNRYEDRPYVPGGSRGGDYGAPPSRGGDPYGGRPPRRETEIYATPAAGYDDRRGDDRRRY